MNVPPSAAECKNSLLESKTFVFKGAALKILLQHHLYPIHVLHHRRNKQWAAYVWRQVRDSYGECKGGTRDKTLAVILSSNWQENTKVKTQQYSHNVYEIINMEGQTSLIALLSYHSSSVWQSSAVDLKTKEEKDAELDRRIEALRKKNEALVKRYQVRSTFKLLHFHQPTYVTYTTRLC